MKYTHTIVECTTAEAAGRALYRRHSGRRSEELARQLWTVVDPNEP